MAKISSIVKNKRRTKLSKKYWAQRQELKKKAYGFHADDNERMDAERKLQKLPLNSSPVRVRNRCALTGRSRGFLRSFKLSRIAFREMALRGMIPGVTKSSW